MLEIVSTDKLVGSGVAVARADKEREQPRPTPWVIKHHSTTSTTISTLKSSNKPAKCKIKKEGKQEGSEKVQMVENKKCKTSDSVKESGIIVSKPESSNVPTKGITANQLRN